MADTAVTFVTGTDTWVSSTDDSDHSDAPYASLVLSQSVYLIRQGLGSNPSGTSAASFVQRFVAFDDFGGGSVTLKLYRVAEPWSTDTGWDDRPDFTADTPKSWTGTLAAGDEITFDTTSFEALRLASPSTDYGYALVLDTSGVSGRIYTLSASDGALGDDSTVRPTLSGTLSKAPDAPYDLAPNNGGAVGAAKPWVEAKFGETEILAVQFQWKSTNTGFDPVTGFASPGFDSGTVTSADPMLDTSRTDMPGGTFGGFSNTASFWTMRVQNSDGVWSQYADPESARWAALPAVTVDSGDFVYDPLLGLDWTVTGTQTRFQVILLDPDDPSTTAADSEETPSADETWQGDYLVPDGRVIDWTLRVWDDVDDRQATPGLPIYTEVSGSYAFADDVTKDKPLGIIAAPIGDSPWQTVTVTLASKLGDDDRLLFVLDGKHIERYRKDDLADPSETEAGWLYSFICWSAQPFTAHIFGAKLITDGKSSKPVEYLFSAHDVTGIWVADRVRETIAQCAGMDQSMQVSDQVGILQGLGANYVSVQVDAIGQKSGTLGGVVTDYADTLAQDWVKAWRDLKNHPAEVQVAYGDTSFPARIWNVLIAPDPSRVSPFDKVVSFEFAQSDKEHLADEPATDVGVGVLTVDIDSIAEGDPVVKTSSGGPEGILDVDGSPTALDAAGKHGTRGIRLNPGDAVTFGPFPNLNGSSCQFYLRFRSNTNVGGTADTFCAVVDVGEHNIAKHRIKASGKLTLEDSGSTFTDKGSQIYPPGTGDDDWLRILPIVSPFDDTSSFVEFKVAGEAETERFSDDLFDIFSTPTGVPYGFTIQTGSHLTIDVCSIQLGDNASELLGPLDPEVGLPSPQLFKGGGTTQSAAIIKTICLVSDEGLTAELDLSTSADMSSPIHAGSATVDSMGLLTHNVTGLATATNYYYRLKSPTTGAYFGEQGQIKTKPATTGGFVWKIAVVSCQGADESQSNAVWQDIVALAPDEIWHLGDYGYWGQSIAGTDPPQSDIDKYATHAQGNPPMRQALQSAGLGAITISDHELHVNGDAWQKGTGTSDDDDDTFNCPHSIRELVAFQALMPIRTYLDTRSPRRHRAYYFDLGSKTRVIVSDFRSPDRNLAADSDGPDHHMWGAAQWADLKGAFDDTRLNIFVNETNWLADTANPNRAHDKPWSYPYYQQDFVDFIGGTGPYAGGPTYKVYWVGGDRHWLSYLSGSNNTLGGFPVAISSGTGGKNSLDQQVGEVLDWEHGANLRTVQSVTPPASGTFTLTYDGQTTAAIDFDATPATVKSALEALSNIAPGDVKVSGGPGVSIAPYVVNFGGLLADNTIEMTASNATVKQEDSPVAGYLQLTITDDGAGNVTVDILARAVLDTSGPTAGWTVSDVPGGTASDGFTP